MVATSLQAVQFLDSQGKPADGLVAVNGRVDKLSIAEQAAIGEAKTFEHVTHVFFRRFNDGRSSQVAAYVVDNSSETLGRDVLALLQKDIWLNGDVPLLYVAWAARVDVVTCARGPDFWRGSTEKYEYHPTAFVEAVTTAADISDQLSQQDRFSAPRLADGTFWDDPSNEELANRDKSARQSLVQAVIDCDNALKGSENPILRRLLLLSVLVKYLEDRGVFPDEWFKQFEANATTFADVLKRGTPDKVRELLKLLERRFNGDIFALPKDGIDLTPKMLLHFATLLEAKTIRRQKYLWEQFSFRHIPVEVISNLYERFIVEGIGAVYTPPILVRLLLDFAMPYSSLSGTEKVIDPSCGSGVFLVGAFRRLVNVWRRDNAWAKPPVAVLKQIVKDQLFGVDRDACAIDLTAFSLALAICDALAPELIWGQLRFDKLVDRSLFVSDFFDWQQTKHARDSDGGRFDIAIGNPPFKPQLTDAGTRVDNERTSIRGHLPGKQAAYLFLDVVPEVLASKGRLCLIQPSTILYNLKARKFVNGLLGSRSVDAVLDFTSIRKLYDGADTKTVALLARPSKPKHSHVIRHYTFRRTFGIHHRIGFELDYYDINSVPQSIALSDPLVWRLNMLGGGRLQRLSWRLREMPTLEQFVKGKGWVYGEGFNVGSGAKPSKFLYGKPLLPPDGLGAHGIDRDKIGEVTDKGFEAERKPELYQSPLLLIKENDGLQSGFLEKGELAYSKEIVGIHAPPPQREHLQAFAQQFVKRRRIYRFCCAVHSSRSMVVKSTALLKKDIDSLPMPEDASLLSLNMWEQTICDDVLKYYLSFVRVGHNSDLLRKEVNATQLTHYCDTFTTLLNTIYPTLKSLPAANIGGLVVQSFCFGGKPKADLPSDAIGDALERLVFAKRDVMRTVRVLRVYSGNVLALVKPVRLRYWLKSIAIRDADDVLSDLQRQGY